MLHFLMLAIVALSTVACAQSVERTGSAPSVMCTPVELDDGVDLVLKRVSGYIIAKKTDDGLELVNKWLAAGKPSAPLETALGELHYSRGEFPLAVTAFNLAMRVDPCYGRAHYFAWRVEALAGEPAKSLAQLELAHRLAPDDPQITETWNAVQLAGRLAADHDAPQVKVSSPGANFFSKSLDCDGIMIQSSAAVDSAALILACSKVQRMLQHLPAVRKSLVSKGGELHIIGEREQTSDLPENRTFRGQHAYRDADGEATDIDVRTRGVGGLNSSCGEENLLRLPSDRYREGEDTRTHEFAHEIMNFGFTDRDRREIERVYKSSTGKGLWKGAYSGVNPREYWATLSMWYFGTHGQFLPSMRPARVPAPGPDGLKAYDPEGLALVDRLYSGDK
jgi:tetratricopeptide (TPR) repeat protein